MMINKEHETIEYRVKVMTAFKNGDTIEHLHIRGGELGRQYKWVKDSEPIWNWYEYDYRVLPKPITKPYCNAQEFFEAMKLHGPSLVNTKFKSYILPIRANDTFFYYFIQSPNNDYVAHYLECRYENANRDWVWQDGTPCGILKENDNE